MKLRYRQCVGKSVRTALFHLMQGEGLLAWAMSAWAKPTLKDWLALTTRRDGVVLLRCEDESGQILGCGLFTRQPYRVWQFDFAAFRAGFHCAVDQARGGFHWAFDHLDCTSIMGVCPLPNRHAWRLAEDCGFRVLARLPEACFHARKQKYVDGVLVLCTRQSLAKAENAENSTHDHNHNHTGVPMGFGGGVSTPDMPAPTPKAEVTKPVTEAASAARDAQKRRANKAAGLSSTILTGSLLDNTAAATSGKTLLGQ